MAIGCGDDLRAYSASRMYIVFVAISLYNSHNDVSCDAAEGARESYVQIGED